PRTAGGTHRLREGLIDLLLGSLAQRALIQSTHVHALAAHGVDEPVGDQLVVGAGGGDDADPQVAGERADRRERVPRGEVAGEDRSGDALADLLVDRWGRGGVDRDVHRSPPPGSELTVYRQHRQWRGDCVNPSTQGHASEPHLAQGRRDARRGSRASSVRGPAQHGDHQTHPHFWHGLDVVLHRREKAFLHSARSSTRPLRKTPLPNPPGSPQPPQLAAQSQGAQARTLLDERASRSQPARRDPTRPHIGQSAVPTLPPQWPSIHISIHILRSCPQVRRRGWFSVSNTHTVGDMDSTPMRSGDGPGENTSRRDMAAPSGDVLEEVLGRFGEIEAGPAARALVAQVLAATLMAFTRTRSVRDPLPDTAPDSAEEALAVLAGIDHLRASLAAVDAAWQVAAEERIRRDDAARGVPS